MKPVVQQWVIILCREPGNRWVRFNSLCFFAKDTKRHPLLFSERNNLRGGRHVTVRGWRIGWEVLP